MIEVAEALIGNGKWHSKLIMPKGCMICSFPPVDEISE